MMMMMMMEDYPSSNRHSLLLAVKHFTCNQYFSAFIGQ